MAEQLPNIPKAWVWSPAVCVCGGGIDYVNKIGNNIVRDLKKTLWIYENKDYYNMKQIIWKEFVK